MTCHHAASDAPFADNLRKFRLELGRPSRSASMYRYYARRVDVGPFSPCCAKPRRLLAIGSNDTSPLQYDYNRASAGLDNP